MNSHFAISFVFLYEIDNTLAVIYH